MSQVVENARNLLLIGADIAELGHSDKPASLRRRILEELMSFETTCRAQNVLSEEWIMACRFALCAFLDERIISTPWGSGCGWRDASLVGELHPDRSPGDAFFLVLERIKLELPRRLDVGELYYLCLKFGFRGRYDRLPGGDSRLEELVTKLGRELRHHAGGYSAPLSVNWQGLRPGPRAWLTQIPLWGWVLASSGVLVLCAVLVSAWINQRVWSLAPQLAALAS